MTPSLPPPGIPAPSDGRLPLSAADGSDRRKYGVYLHVPFCRIRCGYCDFNTYTSAELRGARREDFASDAVSEIALAARVLSDIAANGRMVQTVFFGGGTPTLLPAEDLIRMLKAVESTWGLSETAEITTEANPDSVDEAYLLKLADAGFTRVSFGVQSAVPEVLAVLDRTHDPSRVPEVVSWAKAAGLSVSLDLIYGSPGETIEQWRQSLDQAISLEPDHVSAYSLIVEDGTALARRIKRGEIAGVNEDLQADMYELADEALSAAGFVWYEISNWARSIAARSQHNLGYWRSDDWWGIGPGAHSHIGGVRWWNVRHPAAYADRLRAGNSPAQGREVLDYSTRFEEDILLRVRLEEGMPVRSLSTAARAEVAGLIADDLVDARAAISGNVVLTRRGRLLADAVARRLLAD